VKFLQLTNFLYFCDGKSSLFCFTMTVTELKQYIHTSLSAVVDSGEATAMMREIFHAVRGFSPTDIVIYGHREVLLDTEARVRNIVERVVSGEPLQYVLGTAFFMGMELRVTPATLIPRPETSQLVDRIIDDMSSRADLRVLDIGTGSGCIAIALARALKFADVNAVDISDEALAVAAENAATLRTDVHFSHADALNMPPMPNAYDVIVSNPPYIAEHERADMDARVYDYEPATALFVPDADPLMFYRAIARFAAQSLRPSGKLYFEINPLFVNQLREMLTDTGFADVDIVRDFRGNLRFAICQR
jgi:release factor glutamine methyltransferase